MGSEYGTSSDTTLYNGPFILTGWDGTNQSWSYQKNEDYWDAKNITLDKIDVQVIKEVSTALNLFESGGLDDAILSGESAKQYVDNEAYVVEPEARTNYLQFNYTDVPMFSNAKLREAFSLILDREELANTILGNGSLPATAFVPHDFVTNPVTGNDFADDAGDFLTYDKEKAKQLFDEAKKELGVDTIEIDLLGDDDEASKLVGQYIQGELQNNFEGLTINLSNVPKNNRIEKGQSGDFDIILGGWGAILPDAINLLDIMNSETTFNVGPYKNEKVDQLLNDAETVNANDPEARWQNMLDAQAIMLNEKGFIPLYHTAEVHLRNPKLKGVEVHSVSARYDYRNAYVAE
ncbi:peptide ABC transporter substrate-binding protein [Carnobacterium jeotgali]|nr:peptide ABC transporter substrate-binding protein [Carnobacterium jeotgali]